jgi:PIN domain nuclease of toxin-antitoxin system
MKYLLDTSTAIWALNDKKKLSKAAKTIIDDISIPLGVSIVSAWEIAIKISIGKLNFDGGSELFISKMKRNGIEVLGIEGSHIKCVEMLPLVHRDPFDRLIISTARVERMTIISADENIHKYDVPAVW